MAISNAQKKASQKWDKENMLTLGTKIKKSDAEKFKTYCIGLGKTANQVLREYVYSCIGEPVDGSAGQSDAAANQAPDNSATVEEQIKGLLSKQSIMGDLDNVAPWEVEQPQKQKHPRYYDDNKPSALPTQTVGEQLDDLLPELSHREDASGNGADF